MFKESITVGVITYNSKSTILETLSSIKRQSYGPEFIELVIADDGSVDDTVEVIKKWISENESLFLSVLLIEGTNKGIPENCNRCILNSKSKYIKLLAGDDVLFTHAIAEYTRFAEENDSLIIFSKMKGFSQHIENNWLIKSDNSFFILNASQQLNKLILGYRLQAPSAFFSRRLFDIVGCFSVGYKLMEDLPMWLKIINHEIRFDLLESELIYYRVGGLSQRGKDKLLNIAYEKCLTDFINRDLVNSTIGFSKFICIQDVYIRKMKIFFTECVFKNKYSRFNYLFIKAIGSFSFITWVRFFRL